MLAASVDARSALRIRIMILTSRLELEHAKERLIEGNYAAAQYHMAAARPRTLRMRAAMLLMTIAPQLLRRVCVMLRPTLAARSAAPS